jgi:cytochrome c
MTLTGTGRYVRVNATQRALTQYGYSLWEMEVYGT